MFALPLWVCNAEALLLLWKFFLALRGGHWEVVGPWGNLELAVQMKPRVIPGVLVGTFPLHDRVVGLKGLLAALRVVAAALVVALGHCGLLSVEGVEPEVALGGQSPDGDQEKPPGCALLGEDHLSRRSVARLWW